MGYGSTVVEYLTYNTKIKGLNPTDNTGREKMSGDILIVGCAPAAQWFNARHIILRSRV